MNGDGTVEAIFEMQGMHWATQSNAVESVLRRRKGVVAAQANAVAQTAKVRFDPTLATEVQSDRKFMSCRSLKNGMVHAFAVRDRGAHWQIDLHESRMPGFPSPRSASSL